jgi:hypothetical protein
MRSSATKRRPTPGKAGGFDFLEALFADNLGRNPALLQVKWRQMAEDPFRFFRGSAPAFYGLVAASTFRFSSPSVWICGDAHWENIGSYRAKNKIAYFDLTDFDDCALAPLHVDLVRALTAFFVLKASRLSPHFLSAYRETLRSGKAQHIERDVAKGSIARLLACVAERSRRKFLAEWTEDGRIQMRAGETFALARAERSEAIRTFRAWAQGRKQADFFRLKDICGSSSGVGALGLRRYLVLVEGGRHPHLINMKEAAPSAVGRLCPQEKAIWASEAERVATVQGYLQYVPIAHLGWTGAGAVSFILSDFQPSEDRIHSLSLDEGELCSFTEKWGRLLAWAHLRASGWKKGATADQLIAFAEGLDLRRQHRLLVAASGWGRQIAAAHRAFLPLVAAPTSNTG